MLCEYFIAPDDASAALTLEWIGGPSNPPVGVLGFSTVQLPGLEPTVMMGTLDAILNGRSFEEVLADSSAHEVVSSGAAWVWALTTALQDALVSSDDDRLSEAAGEWVMTEEFDGQADPADAAAAVIALAQMVRVGRDGGRLYCWFSL